MGILRCAAGGVADRFRDAVSVPEMEALTPAPPGTAAASSPPPVAARNCLRSTDLAAREPSMPAPPRSMRFVPAIYDRRHYTPPEPWWESENRFSGDERRGNGFKKKVRTRKVLAGPITSRDFGVTASCGSTHPRLGWRPGQLRLVREASFDFVGRRRASLWPGQYSEEQ